MRLHDEPQAGNGVGDARLHVAHLRLGDVNTALTRLGPKRSAGPDGIPAFVMRDCRPVFAKTLPHVFHLFSFVLQIFIFSRTF